MLVSMKEILDDARARGYGVGFFNTFNPEMILGVMDAAEEMKAPVIIGTAEVLLACCDMELSLAQLLCAARRSPVPVAVHLDHGFTPQTVHKAVERFTVRLPAPGPGCGRRSPPGAHRAAPYSMPACGGWAPGALP